MQEIILCCSAEYFVLHKITESLDYLSIFTENLSGASRVQRGALFYIVKSYMHREVRCLVSHCKLSVFIIGVSADCRGQAEIWQHSPGHRAHIQDQAHPGHGHRGRGQHTSATPPRHQPTGSDIISHYHWGPTRYIHQMFCYDNLYGYIKIVLLRRQCVCREVVSHENKIVFVAKQIV